MNIDDLVELMGVSREEVLKRLDSDEPVSLSLTERNRKLKEEKLLIH